MARHAAAVVLSPPDTLESRDRVLAALGPVQRKFLLGQATLEELAQVLAPEDRHLVRSYADDLQELLNLGMTPEEAGGVVFAGSAEDAIRFLEGEHAEDTLGELRREGLLCGSST